MHYYFNCIIILVFVTVEKHCLWLALVYYVKQSDFGGDCLF